MDFNLTDEQQLLRDGLARFLAARYSLETSRAAAKTGAGWQPDIWRGFANELGVLGAVLPEDVGGIGGGPVELMVIAEELGHALVIEPYIDAVVVAGGLLRRADGAAARSVLKQIIAGTAIVALAAAESNSGDRWQDVSTFAEPDDDGWVLNGSKIMAMGAPLATHLLVTARTPGADGISLFLTGVGASGIEIHPYRTIDDRRAADIEFNDLRLPSDALLGEEGQAGASLAQARDEGAATICSEAIGCMRKVLADNVEYSKQRWQSGQPIGHYFKRLTAIQYEFGTTDQHVARYAELTKT
jgi:alkylation response protein AidB-like acyl-CoA dehydrogenase